MVYKDVWKVINLNEKQDIILKFLREGLSQREISRRTGIARDTIRKYVNYYENKLKPLETGKMDTLQKEEIQSIINQSNEKHLLSC